MKVKTVIRVPKARVTVYPAIVLVSLYAMLEKTSVFFPAFAKYKQYMLIAALLFLLPKIPDILNSVAKKRHIGMFGILVVFAFLSMCSGYAARGLVPDSRPVYFTVNMLAFMAVMYCTIIYTCERGMIKTVIRIYTIIAWIVLIIADAVFLYSRVRLPIKVFVLGGKFTQVYAHIYALAFFFLSDRMSGGRARKHVALLIIYSIYSIAIAILADCMTGLLGYILFITVWILVDEIGLNLMRYLSNPVAVLSLLGLNLLVTFSFEMILQNPDVEDFIVGTLGRSTNMTGRLLIYRDYFKYTKDHLLWGFGAGNQYLVCLTLFRFADTQNAILEWLIQLGAPATIFLMGTIVHAFRCMHRTHSAQYLVPLVLLVYVFVFMGTVEITFSMNFFMWVAVLYGYSQARTVRRR